VLLITEWPEYRDLDWDALAPTMQTPVLLDCRHVLDRAVLERAGFRYLGLA
jgi:UDPglucose 6-dehydrogenase